VTVSTPTCTWFGRFWDAVHSIVLYFGDLNIMANSNSFDLKQASNDVPAPLAFWMMLALVNKAAAAEYAYNKERFQALDGIAQVLQKMADEKKVEKELRLKKTADMLAMTKKELDKTSK